ncbi:MAG: ubiquinone/menaquinone biosynthesis methyltransferase [Anaerolineae bacterium]
MPTEADQRQKRTIRALFTGIATHYDQVNRILSLGRDQSWRRLALKMAEVPAGGRLLDVAAGTGDMALLALQHETPIRVVATDLTPAMLYQARAKARSTAIERLPLTVSDGLALAFADNSFDAVTSAFMMRNVPDVRQAFAEQARVVRPGGSVVCLEMTWPRRFPMRWLFALYFFVVPPLLGRLMTGQREAYAYLPRSVKAFQDPESLAEKMGQSGLQAISWKPLMGGTVVVHKGIKAGSDEI